MAVSFYPPLINGAIERTGTRLMALAILGNLALFGLVLYLMQAVSGVRQELGELVRALARSEYERSHGGESRSGGVAVVIPAYNEAHSLRQLLPGMPLEVCGLPVRAVVVLDGCSDASLRVVRDARTPVTAHAINRGQGDALRTGFALALHDGAEIVVTMDADGQHRPGEIERLVRPIADGHADLVVGSRFAGAYADRGSVRHAGVLGFSWFMSRLTGVTVQRLHERVPRDSRVVSPHAPAARDPLQRARAAARIGGGRATDRRSAGHHRGTRGRPQQEAADLALRVRLRARDPPDVAPLVTGGLARTWPGELIALAIVAILSALIVPIVGTDVTGNSAGYLIQARQISAGEAGGNTLESRGAMARGPMFPLLLALGFRAGSPTVQTAVTVTRIFFAASVLLTYAVARMLAGRAAGVAAALLVLTSFGLNQIATYIDTDTVLPAFMLGFLLLYGSRSADRGPSTRRAQERCARAGAGGGSGARPCDPGEGDRLASVRGPGADSAAGARC